MLHSRLTMVYLDFLQFNLFNFSKFSTVCGGNLRAEIEAKQLYSHPQYGDTNYITGRECDWLLTAQRGYGVELEFPDFEVEFGLTILTIMLAAKIFILLSSAITYWFIVLFYRIGIGLLLFCKTLQTFNHKISQGTRTLLYLFTI